MAVSSSRGGAFSPYNPPPDDADPLNTTAYNPFTRVYNPVGDVTTTDSAGAVRVAYNDSRLTYNGAGGFSVGATAPDPNYYAASSLYPHNRESQPVFAVEFFTDAPWFEFQVKYEATTAAYRLLVDGRRVTDAATMVSTTAAPMGYALNYRFDFPTAKPRRITIQLAYMPFSGVFIPSTASLWAVPAYQDRTLILADSITGGSTPNNGWAMGTWLHRVALMMGWEDVWNQSIGGTGYVATNNLANFGARATGTVTGSTGGANDIGQYALANGNTRVIIFGGYNDTASTVATIQSAAATLYQNVKAALPTAQIIVFGCYSPTATAGATLTTLTNIDAGLQSTAAAAGLPFISPITGSVYNQRGTLITTQGPWITAANQAAYLGVDGVHPNDAGHVYLARRIASALQSLQKASSTIEPWAGGLHAAIDDGQPSNDKEWNYLNGPSTLATLTPTALTTSVARCWSYNCQFPIVVNRLRWYGIGATTTHNVAVYRQSDGVRVIGPLALTTTADAWNSIAVSAVTLAPNTPYIVALSTTATGTTAGLRTSGTPLLYPPLQASSPGGIALSVGDHRFWFGQFAVTTGALPATLPTLVRGSGWTAGLPLFFFDSNSAA